MFSIILRVLTIAGTCTLAAMLTRKYLEKRAEREARTPAALPAKKVRGAAVRELETRDSEDSGSATPENELDSRRKMRDELQAKKSESVSESTAERSRLRSEMEELARNAESARAEAASAKEELLAARDKHLAGKDELQSKTEQMKLEAQELKQKAEERSEKVAKSKQAALAAQQAVKAFRKDAADSQIAVQKNDLQMAPPPPNPAMERARLVLDSSRQILDNYKMPTGLIVDLSLARFSLDTADRLMAEGRYDDAWEKAGAVGMIVGISEMRAAIEQQLKEMKKDPDRAEKVKLVRSALNEADLELAEASKSFVSEKSGNGEKDYTQHLQAAFQKTMQADAELQK